MLLQKYVQKTYYVKLKLTNLHAVCYFVYPLHKMQYNPLPRQHRRAHANLSSTVMLPR